MAKTTPATKTKPAAPANANAAPTSFFALPLGAKEKDITRNAQRALIAVAAQIRTATKSLTTHEAATAFWDNLMTYCAQNVASVSGKAPDGGGKKKPTGKAMGLRGGAAA